MADKDRALDVRTQKGFVGGDQTVTTAVEYLDLSTWFGGQGTIWVRITPIGIGLYYLPVESITPATAPTVAAVTGNGAMNFIPQGGVETVLMRKTDPVLAYAGSGSGSFRVVRG